MEEIVLDFIHRRFTTDCNWTNGNCYWFAIILKERFNLKIYYLPVPGHFVAGDGEEFYDFNGRYDIEDNTPIIQFEELKVTDISHYQRLIENCVK